ncbi:unnamed protein product, partial [Iphiclides podalirius]
MDDAKIDTYEKIENEKSALNGDDVHEGNKGDYETLDEVKQHNEIKSETHVDNEEKVHTERDSSVTQEDIIIEQNVKNQDIIEKEEGEVEGKEVKDLKEDQEAVQEEEEAYVEEPPPDPAAPLNLKDSTEALKPSFELRPDQLSEVEQLWELFQDYNPAYTDLDNFITEKELVYMLKSLLLMTYTPEQLQELIDYCVRPPHPEGHINYEQFLKIVIIRQRDLPIEEELRSALQALDPAKSGVIDREFMKDVLSKQGNKLSPKHLDNLIKEVDISNDGTIGIEDVVGTMCIDLNKDDILMLRAALNPESQEKKEEEF